MAFGTTDRVETTPWRAQAQRAAQTPRAADPARPRFAESLPKAEPAQTPRPADRAAADRSQDARDAQAARDTQSQKDAQAARDAKTARDAETVRDAKTTRDAKADASGRADAADRRKADKPETGDATGQAPSDGAAPAAAQASETAEAAAKAAKAERSDEAAGAPTGATAIATPTPTVPVAPQPAAPAPAGTSQAADGVSAEGGMQAAGALPSGAPRGVPLPTTAATQPGEAEGETGETTDAPPGAAKDFLAALSDAGGAGGAKADASGALPTSPAPAGATVTGGPAATVHATAPAAQAPAPPAVPIGQVPMTIGLRSLAGSSEFQIRLDPIELGRIDVKLEIDKAKGTVATHLTVDRPDTLALLQRDAGQLQQALSQAGLDAGAGGVSLSLRGDGGGQANGQGGQPGGDGRPATPWSTERADTLPETAPLQRLRGYGGLDIRI